MADERYTILPQSRIQTDNLETSFKRLTGGQRSITTSEGEQIVIREPLNRPPKPLSKHGVLGRHPSNVHPRTDFLEPQVRDPLLSATNFYLPTDRVLFNAWIRYFDRFHPIVGNAIDMHATVPFSKFQLKGIDDPSIRRFFEDMATEINLFRRILEISREYELIGEVFPFAYWDEEMNAFSDIVVLNPDTIEVVGIYLSGEKTWRYELVPDPTVLAFLRSENPLDWEIVQEIDPAILRAAQTDTNAPLDPFNVSHLARKQSPYEDRGTSLVMGCIKDLLYEEQLLEAQYAITGGIVRPREIWKLGIPGEYTPTDGDLQDLRDLLAASEFDPNFALISHHGVTVEFVGADRRILPIIPERKEIEARLLTRLYTNKAVTHGEGPCLTETDLRGEKQEVLTQRGFVPWDEVGDGEAIASFNPETEQIEFHVPRSRIVRDYDGLVVDLGNPDASLRSMKRTMDLSVTVNHRMWVQDGIEGEWKILPADKLVESHRLRCDMKPQAGGGHPEAVTIEGYRRHRWNDKHEDKRIEIQLDDYLAFAGYYVSEGSLDFEHRYGTSHPSGVTVSQLPTSRHYQRIRDDLDRLPFNVSFGGKDRFRVCDRLFAEHVFEEFGHGASNKRIPGWFKQLPAEKLEIVIAAMLAGDGHDMGPKGAEYYTVSEQLARDFQEMAFRAGYATFCSGREREGNRKPQYRCRISNGKAQFSRRPTLDGSIRSRHYNGRVWCFEVPPHELFVVRSGGKVYIVGNTFSNASVAMQFISARYATKRDFITEWIRDKIFLPTALANEFYKPLEGHKTSGQGPWIRSGARDRELVIPDFQWLSLVDLTDKGQKLQYAMQLATQARLPMKVILDLLQIDAAEVDYYLDQEEGTRLDPIYQSTRKMKEEAKARVQETSKLPGGGGGGNGDNPAQQITEELRDQSKKDEKATAKPPPAQPAATKTEPAQPKTEPSVRRSGRVFGGEGDVKKKEEMNIIAGSEMLDDSVSGMFRKGPPDEPPDKT